MALDQALITRARDAIGDQALQRGLTLREKHMFGGPAFKDNDKIVCA